jgi:beta-xylosidase
VQIFAQTGASYTNPVQAGDYPDPSVIRVGKDFYATATSSEWGPEFPILHSTDLVNWNIVGVVFPRRPEWSVGNYWAPEIWQENGKFYIFYVARRKDGPLCIAAATAAKPTGPYTDHGALECQEVGSIDAFPIRDENGKLFVVWKEDGNSVGKPTPLWAQELDTQNWKLVGKRQEILRNDPSTWEGNLWKVRILCGATVIFICFIRAMPVAGAAVITRWAWRARKLFWELGKRPGESDSERQ